MGALNYSYKEVRTKLLRVGAVYRRRGKGSHEIWYYPKTKSIIVVNAHGGTTLTPGMVNDVIKKLGLTVEEFHIV